MKREIRKVLVVNAGSSSLKYMLFDMKGEKMLCKGLVERIRSAPEGDFDIDVEAARCHITTAHFRRLFKRRMGVPPRQFIIYCRLEKAAAMLLRGHSSVAEVALCSGFTDQNYFARMFKQQYRITPLEYRRTFR